MSSKKKEIRTLELGIHCRLCGSPGISISLPGVLGRPDDWPENALGLADCRRCGEDYFVTLPQSLFLAVSDRLQTAKGICCINDVLRALFATPVP